MSDTNDFNPEDYFKLWGITEAESSLRRKFHAGNFLLQTNGYWIPPIDFIDLALLERAHPYHQLALEFETEKMLEYFLPASMIRYQEFEKIAADYFSSGNAFYLKNRNILGQVAATNNGLPAISHLPFVYMRLMTNGHYCQLDNFGNIVKTYNRNDVGHIKKYDKLQNAYGIPPWIAQLQSIMFGEDSILTPRRELTAGITRKIIGFLGLNNDQLKGVIDNFKASKGHQEMTAFLGLPDKDGKKLDDIMKIYPDDSTFKVDFEKFIRLSNEIIIECHQIPWFLIGAQPDKGSSPPDLDKVIRIYARKILIMLMIFEVMNEDVPGAVVFDKQKLLDLITPAKV
jgi:hypothetical protein